MTVPSWVNAFNGVPATGAPQWIVDFFADMHANKPAWIKDLYPLPPPPPPPSRFLALTALMDGHVAPVVESAGTWTLGTPVATGGSLAYSTAITPDSARGLVALYNDGKIAPLSIDSTSGAVSVGSLVVTGTGPIRVKIASDGVRALVCHWGEATVADMRYSGGVWAKHAAITTALQQFGLDIAPDGLSALAASYGTNAVTPLYWSGTEWSAGTPVGVSGGTRQVVIAPDGLTALVMSGSVVTILKFSGGVWSAAGSTLTVGSNAYSAAITPDGLTAIVVCTDSSTAYVLSKVTGSWLNAYTISTGADDYDIAITQDGNRAFVLNGESTTHRTLLLSSGVWAVDSYVTIGQAGNGVCIGPLVG